MLTRPHHCCTQKFNRESKKKFVFERVFRIFLRMKFTYYQTEQKQSQKDNSSVEQETQQYGVSITIRKSLENTYVCGVTFHRKTFVNLSAIIPRVIFVNNDGIKYFASEKVFQDSQKAKCKQSIFPCICLIDNLVPLPLHNGITVLILLKSY